jgi:hypothetical protein
VIILLESTIRFLKHDVLVSRFQHDANWIYRSNNPFYYVNQLQYEDNDGSIKPTASPISLRKSDFSPYRRTGLYADFNFWSLCSGESHQVAGDIFV